MTGFLTIQSLMQMSEVPLKDVQRYSGVNNGSRTEQMAFMSFTSQILPLVSTLCFLRAVMRASAEAAVPQNKVPIYPSLYLESLGWTLRDNAEQLVGPS